MAVVVVNTLVLLLVASHVGCYKVSDVNSVIGGLVGTVPSNDENLLANIHRQLEQHKIQKRQGSEDPDDNSYESKRCERLALDRLCMSGAFQDYADVLQKCRSSDVEIFKFFCIPNNMGGVCYTLSFEPYTENICNSSSTNCSPMCKDRLVSLRNELGCCIASLYNTSGPYDLTNYFTYDLWSKCDVEPVTQKCPPSSITFPPQETDPTCINNVTATLQLGLLALCQRDHVEPLQNLLSKENCPSYKQCQATKSGDYCRIADSNDPTYSLRRNGICNDSSECDPVCRESLTNVSNTLGCCLNTYYNSTNTTDTWLEYKLWSRCNLKTPGLVCKDYLTGGTITASTTAVTTSPSSGEDSKTLGVGVIVGIALGALGVVVVATLCVVIGVVVAFSKARKARSGAYSMVATDPNDDDDDDEEMRPPY